MKEGNDLHTLIKLIKWLHVQILENKIDDYNEYTRSWSKGRIYGWKEVMDKINEFNNEKIK